MLLTLFPREGVYISSLPSHSMLVSELFSTALLDAGFVQSYADNSFVFHALAHPLYSFWFMTRICLEMTSN